MKLKGVVKHTIIKKHKGVVYQAYSIRKRVNQRATIGWKKNYGRKRRQLTMDNNLRKENTMKLANCSGLRQPPGVKISSLDEQRSQRWPTTPGLQTQRPVVWAQSSRDEPKAEHPQAARRQSRILRLGDVSKQWIDPS
uniref:Uncharacterized protein n=1 Tax=Romanomermis culicivorax TaxID=13658 RepID=A0A915KZ47_ROMCU